MKEFQKQIFDMIKSAYNGVDMMRGDKNDDMVFELNTLYDKIVSDREMDVFCERINGIRVLGEFIGACEGISCWNIPDELREVLKNRIKKLKKLSEDWMEK